jgi:hypothetical protein
VGYTIKQKLKETGSFYKNRDSQIEAIEHLFEAVKKTVQKHYSKQGVYAVQELPIFPDFEVISCF